MLLPNQIDGQGDWIDLLQIWILLLLLIADFSYIEGKKKTTHNIFFASGFLQTTVVLISVQRFKKHQLEFYNQLLNKRRPGELGSTHWCSQT